MSQVKVVLRVVVLSIASVGAIFLTIFLVRFNRKRLHIIRRAQEAPNEDLEAIYVLLDEAGREKPACAILARTNRTAPSDSALIPIPAYVSPWGGKVLEVHDGRKGEVSFRFADDKVAETQCAGRIWRVIPAPRTENKSGKTRNHLGPARYLKDPRVLSALASICPAYPAELLSYLLSAGAETFELDWIDQLRLGGKPSWIQDPEFPICPDCKNQMSLICQMPGSLIRPKPLPNGTLYFFGCSEHVPRTSSIAQFG